MRRAGLERMMLLRSFPQLADLAPVTLAAMAELSRDNFFPAGSEIYREGEPVREIQYLLGGAAEVRRRGRTIRRFGPRSVLGGLAALAGTADGPQVVAVEDTPTLSFTQEDQLDVFEDNFELMVVVLRGVATAAIEARLAAGPTAGFRVDDKIDPIPPRRLALVEKLALLRHSAPFAEARLEAVGELVRDSPEVRFAAGETIWRAGDPSGHSLLVVAGAIDGRTDGGRQQFRFGTRSVVGGVDSLAGVPRWFDAVAATELVALQMPVSALLDLFEDHVDMAMDLLRVMARGVLELRDRNADRDAEGA